MTRPKVLPLGNAVTIVIPLTVRKWGGRKLVVVPEGADQWAPAKPRIDNALIKAVARAFRWKAMLDSGRFATIKELAAAEKINMSYLSRILRLAFLAPDIVEGILEGRQSPELWQDKLRGELPGNWDYQRLRLGNR